MTTRFLALGRFGLPLVLAAAVAATLVPAQVASAAPPRPVAVEEDEDYPAPPGVGDVVRNNPEVAAIIKDADEALRYSMAVVTADPSRQYPADSVEEVLRQGLLTMPEDRRKTAAESARRLINDVDYRKRTFGRHGSLEPAKYADLGFAGVFTPESVPVAKEALKRRLLDRAAQLEAKHRQEEAEALEVARRLHIPPNLQIPTLTSLDYRIDWVKCVDETNPEWPGDDEIAMGGTRVDHEGVTEKVNQFMVDDSFDDGEKKTYTDPGKLFTRFDLTTAGDWARTYNVVVMLAEKDGSGFADAINVVWAKVKDQVQQIVAQVIAGIISVWLGAAIGEAIGQAVAWLVTTFFSWLFELFLDDLFNPGIHGVYLPNRYEWMYKNPANYGWTDFRQPPGMFTFVGHGGTYKVKVHWQVNP